jgi:hypothetical protein
MSLTRKQKKLVGELERACEICRIDFWNVEDDYEPEWRTSILGLVMRKLITAYVVETYTFVDEQLNDMICNIYFRRRTRRPTYKSLWRTKRFSSFVHNALDNLYPLHKMRLVHDIKPIPKEHRDTIQRLNDVRNALAHSFFPENRRSYREHKKVMWRDLDLFTIRGLEKFDDERQALVDYLWYRTYGKLPAH